MTMPNERTRALRWGYEVLQQICEDHSVSGDQRSEAAELLRVYPPPIQVTRWIQEDVACIPLLEAIAIERMSELLQIMNHQSTISPELRRSIALTHRHHPQPGDAEGWAVAHYGLSIRNWLLPEDQYG